MNKRTLVALSVAGLTACIASTASASGLVGGHYLSAGLTSQNWGDSYSAVEDDIGRSYGTTIVANYNLAENWDFNASYTGIWDSYTTMISTNVVNADVDQQTVLAGFNYLFPNSSSVTPYIGGGAGVIRTTIDTGASDTESDAAFAGKLGAEWDVCEEAFLDLGITYTYLDSNLLENNDFYGISLSTGIKIIDHLLLVGNASYSIDEDAASFTVGLAIQ